MRIRVLELVLLCCLTPAYAGSGADRPLSLEEVLSAALRAFPGLLSTEQKKEVAEGNYQTAEGGFDTLFKSKNRWSIAGIYENQMNDVSLEQPTPFMGATFFGGWRRGSGDYPVYEGKSQTADDGEVRLGVNIPLWRNRDIDSRRAKLQQAELGKLIASHEYDQALLEVRRLASQRYWDWLMAGQRLKVADRLLQIAEARNAGILERAAAGDIADFEALDNQRAILERRERRVAAQRLLEQSAIQLSMYWRDTDGQPQLPDLSLMPDDFPDREPALDINPERAIQTALDQRPELKRLGLQKRQTETELELQQNQRAPGVDFSVMGAKDVGYSSQKINRDELYLGLNVDIPLQQRVAGGRAQAASANLRRLKWDQQLLEDKINNEIQDALSAIKAARQRVQLSRQQWQAAEKLEQGEQSRFELGDSTLLFVNLREIANGDAALKVAETKATLFKAHADFQAALGSPVQAEMGPPTD
ncbi:TolC family protein [Methylomonas methanica]|uniref:TolC-like outermembrane protein n=1 Tax=Methylomonas methanica (strain DSM 25384 / MC09) TaxID=857087 RepID=G0A5C7_METMM|nr:TolC family protein [Methylomonas methanica]AEG01633.1 TolC-like outermembrane protein [Methylomonas methanica MC09]